jgi:hypothetical protein
MPREWIDVAKLWEKYYAKEIAEAKKLLENNKGNNT